MAVKATGGITATASTADLQSNEAAVDVKAVRQDGSAAWQNARDSGGVWGAKAGVIYVRAVVLGQPGTVEQAVSAPVKFPDPLSSCPAAWSREGETGLPIIFGDQQTVAKPTAQAAPQLHGDGEL